MNRWKNANAIHYPWKVLLIMIRKVIGDDGQKCRFDFDTSQLFKSQAHTWRINIIFRFIEIPTFIAHCIYFSSRQKPSGNITKVTFNLKWITKELKDVWKTHQLSLLPQFGSTIKTISKARQKKTHKKKTDKILTKFNVCYVYKYSIYMTTYDSVLLRLAPQLFEV